MIEVGWGSQRLRESVVLVGLPVVFPRNGFTLLLHQQCVEMPAFLKASTIDRSVVTLSFLPRPGQPHVKYRVESCCK